MTEPLVKIKNLKSHFFTDEGVVKAVDDVTLTIPKGKTVGLVGESGCGKSVTAMSIIRLISSPGRIVEGSILFHDRGKTTDLTKLSERRMRSFRGARISMIFQEPMTSLNPVFTIGDQIMEAVLLHEPLPRKWLAVGPLYRRFFQQGKARRRAIELLEKTKINIPENRFAWLREWKLPLGAAAGLALFAALYLLLSLLLPLLLFFLPGWIAVALAVAVAVVAACVPFVWMSSLAHIPRFDDYPHQFSGGMRQRVMIAMALAARPKLLIADEPSTALDVTIQAQILDLLRDLQQETGMSILFITHDLGVIAEMADEVAVMYASKIVEQAPVGELFGNPRHPYTHGLFDSRPRPGMSRDENLYAIKGMVPSPLRFPSGCKFHPRCPYREDVCISDEPELREIRPLHFARCHFAEEIDYAAPRPAVAEIA